MCLCRLERDSSARITRGPRRRDRAPTPGTTQIQPVEVSDLSIAAVADNGGREQRRRLSYGEPREKAVEPTRELACFQHPAHALGLHQCRGQEVIPTRLPRLTIRIFRVPGARFIDQGFAKTVVARDLRILQCQSNGEGAVEVRSYARWVRCLRQEIQEALTERVSEQRKRVDPPLAFYTCMSIQFGGKHQQPRPSVWALERCAQRLTKVSEFRSHFRGRELRVEQPFDFCGLPHLRKEPQQRREKPVSVHTRVPVETSEKNRVQITRGFEV